MHVRTVDSRRLDGCHLGARGVFLKAQQSLDFEELADRLTAFGLRTFNEFGLGGRNSTVAGVGLSVDDFVSAVLVEYMEGQLQHQDSRGALFRQSWWNIWKATFNIKPPVAICSPCWRPPCAMTLSIPFVRRHMPTRRA